MATTSECRDWHTRARGKPSWLLICTALVTIPTLTHGEEPEYRAQLKLPVLAEADNGADSPHLREPKLDWETGAGKSYLIPALDIIGFQVLLNEFDRHFVDPQTYAMQRGVDRQPLLTMAPCS